MENAVAAARPETWQRRYENDRFITDEMRFSLALTVAGKRYETSWRSATREMLPSDLEALDVALWSARKASMDLCR